jgi:hypothetical protein
MAQLERGAVARRGALTAQKTRRWDEEQEGEKPARRTPIPKAHPKLNATRHKSQKAEPGRKLIDDAADE